jgi:predicted small lipoprotein YifL
MNANRNTPAVTLIAIIATLSCALALSGCGQKGNLYLPNQKKKVPAAQPQPNTQAQPDNPSQPEQSQPVSGAH